VMRLKKQPLRPQDLAFPRQPTSLSCLRLSSSTLSAA
jgi:hypothetical protein